MHQRDMQYLGAGGVCADAFAGCMKTGRPTGAA